MKTAETNSSDALPARVQNTVPSRLNSSKIAAVHLERLAVVYVRQSSPRQVVENRESTARQYAFADQAVALGWPRARVMTIDEDLGKSGRTVEGRSGFQRLVTEVTLNHVGMVLGLDMSRLARSSKDWHAFFEMCAIFGTLIADEDGVYDANDPNDRLLLGLKGIMSEMELHIMRNRLERGRDQKAQRGELFIGVPMGYVLLPTGEVALDPDEQARHVVRLIFEKFQELGSIYAVFHWFNRNDLRLPIRPQTGPKKGQLDWRPPNVSTLSLVLSHPIYAGAYSYGRRPVDPKRKFSAQRRYRPSVPMEQWKVLRKDHLPAYITWDQFLKNRERVQHNRNRPGFVGVARNGAALLPGLLLCGNCGCRMQARYHANGLANYSCTGQYRQNRTATDSRCYGLTAKVLDDLVAQQVLRALEPAVVELSLQAHADIERERHRLEKHWQQRRQRAQYEVDLAERRYQAVDPENRLVAATLEKRWEELLGEARQLQEEYERFLRERPTPFGAEERARVVALSSNIPALWNSANTSNADRKQILRCLVERVTVQVRYDSEFVGATIHWAGGYESQHEIVRPVANYAQLRDFEQLMKRIVAMRQEGRSAADIAERLNAEGFCPPRRQGPFTTPTVRALLKCRAFVRDEDCQHRLLGPHEWWLTDLARHLRMSHLKLRDWANRGWVHSRRTALRRNWILWADADEIQRLRDLLAESRRGINAYTSALKTPKKRPADQASEPRNQ